MKNLSLPSIKNIKTEPFPTQVIGISLNKILQGQHYLPIQRCEKNKHISNIYKNTLIYKSHNQLPSLKQVPSKINQTVKPICKNLKASNQLKELTTLKNIVSDNGSIQSFPTFSSSLKLIEKTKIKRPNQILPRKRLSIHKLYQAYQRKGSDESDIPSPILMTKQNYLKELKKKPLLNDSKNSSVLKLKNSNILDFRSLQFIELLNKEDCVLTDSSQRGRARVSIELQDEKHEKESNSKQSVSHSQQNSVCSREQSSDEYCIWDNQDINNRGLTIDDISNTQQMLQLFKIRMQQYPSPQKKEIKNEDVIKQAVTLAKQSKKHFKKYFPSKQVYFDDEIDYSVPYDLEKDQNYIRFKHHFTNVKINEEQKFSYIKISEIEKRKKLIKIEGEQM